MVELKAYRNKKYKDLYLGIQESVIRTVVDVAKAIGDFEAVDLYIKKHPSDDIIGISTKSKAYTDEEGYSGTLYYVIKHMLKDFEIVTFVEKE